MKNEALRHLNFCELLGYPKEFQPKHRYDEPITCTSFCVECEKSGTLDKAKGKLTLISHGCDTADFETIFASALPAPEPVQMPILFLLDEPGGDYDLGEDICYDGITKKPPVNHYYWSSSLKEWPDSTEELAPYYGSYFAYIMRRHSLKNVYITNLVKCKGVGVENPNLIEELCTSRFLTKEIREFAPAAIFCFGKKVYNSMRARFPDQHQRCLYLYHPSFIGNYCQTKGLSSDDAILVNERWMDEKLRSLNAFAHHPGHPSPH